MDMGFHIRFVTACVGVLVKRLIWRRWPQRERVFAENGGEPGRCAIDPS